VTKLQIQLHYEQPLEIQIEFPVAVLASYHGGSNLDIIWDDTIAPLIHKSLRENQVQIKSTTLRLTTGSKELSGRLSYQLFLIAKPPLFDFNWIIAALATAGFLQGLHLKLATKAGLFESCYDHELLLGPSKKLTSLE
jgi:hypothetical protein